MDYEGKQKCEGKKENKKESLIYRCWVGYWNNPLLTTVLAMGSTTAILYHEYHHFFINRESIIASLPMLDGDAQMYVYLLSAMAQTAGIAIGLVSAATIFAMNILTSRSKDIREELPFEIKHKLACPKEFTNENLVCAWGRLDESNRQDLFRWYVEENMLSEVAIWSEGQGLTLEQAVDYWIKAERDKWYPRLEQLTEQLKARSIIRGKFTSFLEVTIATVLVGLFGLGWPTFFSNALRYPLWFIGGLLLLSFVVTFAFTIQTMVYDGTDLKGSGLYKLLKPVSDGLVSCCCEMELHLERR